MRSISLLFLTLVAALALVVPTLAQGPPADLFTTAPTRTARGKNGLAASRGRVNTDPLNYGAANIRIQLPDGDTIVFRQDKFEQRGDQDTAWRGVVQGRDDSLALLTLKSGMVAGVLRIGHDLYEIRPGADGQHVIEKLDEASFPACAGSHAPPGEGQQNDAPAEAATANLETAVAAATTVDVMVVYTTATRNAAGGATQIQATIQAAVDSANTAFGNSQVNLSYRLVGTAEVTYTETGNIQTDLGWLQANTTVANLRTTYGADLVSLFVENGGGYCGVGYLYNGSASYAHQVTARSCAVGNLTYAHEHGHNLGMNHDPANGGSGGYATDSYGHFVEGQFRTVMSYNNAGSCTSCPRVAYFSNPSVNYNGYATGISGQRNNAATGNATAASVAAFLAATSSSSAPTAPSSLTAAPVSGTQVNLTWGDNSANETGFLIERSTDSVNFTQIASVSANVVSYSNTGLASLATYYYRVRAAGTTNSAYSNTASATTPGTPPNAPGNLTATASSTSQVNLLWTDNATNESGFLIERSTDNVNFTQIATTTVNIVNYSNTGLTAGATYYYRVRANNGAGNSGYSNTAQAVVPQVLVAPWTSVDLNAPGLAGSASQANGSFTISGAGTISGKADKFRFTYQALSGDGEIKARLNTVQNTGTNARVGVMIRDALTGGSRHAFMGVHGTGGYYWMRRSSTNGSSSSTASGSGVAPNIWVRLVRTGNTVYGYKSTDGLNWTLVNSASITMGVNIYIGFAVASGSTTTLNTSVFNTVTVVP